MPAITYVTHEGIEYTVNVPAGKSVMEGAVQYNVPGITADCGGACVCGTCAVRIDDAWINVVGAPSAVESSMLEYGTELGAAARLSCQIRVDEQIDGLVVHVPASQQSC